MVNKTERKKEFIAIVVGQVGTLGGIQNVLLGVRPVGNVKGKIILLVSGNQTKETRSQSSSRRPRS